MSLNAVTSVKEEGLYLIYGKAGSGKTSLANFLAVDGKTAVVTFDKSHSVLKDAMKAKAIDVFSLDMAQDFKESNFQATLNGLESALKGYKYVVFDNISALEYFLTADHKTNLGINDTRQAYQIFQNEMFALCQLCIELDPICLITAWEVAGAGDYGITRAQPQLNAKVSAIFAGFSQAVIRSKPEGGNFYLWCDPSAQDYYGKNRKNTINQLLCADIVKFLGT